MGNAINVTICMHFMCAIKWVSRREFNFLKITIHTWIVERNAIALIFILWREKVVLVDDVKIKKNYTRCFAIGIRHGRATFQEIRWHRIRYYALLFGYLFGRFAENCIAAMTKIDEMSQQSAIFSISGGRRRRSRRCRRGRGLHDLDGATCTFWVLWLCNSLFFTFLLFIYKNTF